MEVVRGDGGRSLEQEGVGRGSGKMGGGLWERVGYILRIQKSDCPVCYMTRLIHGRPAEGVGWLLHDGAGGERKLFGFAALGEWSGGKSAGRWGESGIFSEIPASGGLHNSVNPCKSL